MRIFDGAKELAIPQWITVSDSSLHTVLQTVSVNDRHGLAAAGLPTYQARTFSCSGTIFAATAAEVEQERSHLAASLTGKTLTVYRDDDDEIHYRCVLMGDIRTSYYSGVEISRAFGISFTLKALDPFGYGKAHTITAPLGVQRFTVSVDGNYPTLPRITIHNIPYAEGVLLECEGSVLEVNKRIALGTGESLLFENGCLYKSGHDISIRLAKRAVINPLILQAGSNTIISHIPQAAITLDFQGRYR